MVVESRTSRVRVQTFHSLTSYLPIDLIDCAGSYFGPREVMLADTDNKRCLRYESTVLMHAFNGHTRCSRIRRKQEKKRRQVEAFKFNVMLFKVRNPGIIGISDRVRSASISAESQSSGSNICDCELLSRATSIRRRLQNSAMAKGKVRQSSQALSLEYLFIILR